ncbi:uncharacterized protein BDW70DRAFT_67104 [Aspergillus foveolatus]|uniref:uncharacterized protein n=1 Tax=Aspergillus foveolatus TaxID=210207 RepID=UPI003CCCDBBC
MAQPEDPLTPGLSNNDLWRLIRRFDKQVSHVEAIPCTAIHQLDLNRTADEQFPASKLQKTIERFYVSVLVKVGLFISHINHLRSWNDPRRTGLFGAVYLIAWLCDFIIPLLSGVLLAMIFSPATRSSLFPPVPESESQTQGQPSSTEESTLHVHAPPVNEGEAEDEAADLVNGIKSSIQQDAQEAIGIPPGIDGLEPEIVTASDTAGADEPGKAKASPAIRITLRVISDISDLCERFSNLLSPTPPFSLIGPRLQLAAILMLIFLASLSVSSHMIVKTSSLAVGFGFFGDPVLSRAMDFLNTKIPNWKTYLDIEKTLLKGVPTDAQLTLTLLRIGELNSSPLSVPPLSDLASRSEQSPLKLFRRKSSKTIETGSDAPDAIDSNQTQTETGTVSSAGESTKKSKAKKWLRILKFARRAITTAIKGHVAYNRAMGLTGAGSRYYAKSLLSAALDRNLTFQHLSVLALGPPSSHHLHGGPFTFEAKFERKRGTAVLDFSDNEHPILYFTSKNAAKIQDDLRVDSQKGENVLFRVPVADIRELRKTEGLGWKGKLIVQLAAGGEGSTEGLVVLVKDEDGVEKSYHLTGMRGRNVLFNRLVAGGGQCWKMH